VPIIALLALGPAPVTELLLATWAAQRAVVVNISGGWGIPDVLTWRECCG
jgi:hypothetical protein